MHVNAYLVIEANTSRNFESVSRVLMSMKKGSSYAQKVLEEEGKLRSFLF